MLLLTLHAIANCICTATLLLLQQKNIQNTELSVQHDAHDTEDLIVASLSAGPLKLLRCS